MVNPPPPPPPPPAAPPAPTTTTTTTSSSSPPPIFLRGPADYAAWKADVSSKMYATIASSLDPSQQAHIAHCAADGKAAWETFERLYDHPGRVALRRKLYRHSEQHPDESIDAYVRRKKDIVDRLRDIGASVLDDELADTVLMDVNDKFRAVSDSIAAAGTRAYRLDEVLQKLRDREKVLSGVGVGVGGGGVMMMMNYSSSEPPPPPPPPITTTAASSNPTRKLPPILAPAPPPLSVTPLQNNIDSADVKKPSPKTTPRSRSSGKRVLAAAPSTSNDDTTPAATDSTPPPPPPLLPPPPPPPPPPNGQNGETPSSSSSSPTKRKSEGSPDSSSTPTTTTTAKKPRISTNSSSRSARKPKLPPPTSPRTATPQRPFRCLFTFAGCTQSFASKNEWKRHINHIHLQLWYWRCDFPACANRKAFFNRKDLFGQHLKRMHSEHHQQQQHGGGGGGGEACAEIQERCKKERRKPPEASKCGFCKKVFEGAGSWEGLVDHVGDHYAQGARWEEWSRDGGFEEWALKEGVVRKSKDGGYSQDERQYPSENQP